MYDDGFIREFIPNGRIVYEWSNDDCDYYYIKKSMNGYTLWFIEDYGTCCEKDKEPVFSGSFMQCMVQLNAIIVSYEESKL